MAKVQLSPSLKIRLHSTLRWGTCFLITVCPEVTLPEDEGARRRNKWGTAGGIWDVYSEVGSPNGRYFRRLQLFQSSSFRTGTRLTHCGSKGQKSQEGNFESTEGRPCSSKSVQLWYGFSCEILSVSLLKILKSRSDNHVIGGWNGFLN